MRRARVAVDARRARRRARRILAPPPERLRAVPLVSPPEAGVTVHVASLNTAAATERCVRTARELAGYPHTLIVGDSGSTDGSVERLRELEREGVLTLQEAGPRLHGEWLDEWRATCATPLAVFADSDVEFLEHGWLSRLVHAWSASGAAIVCAEYLDDLRRFREPAGGETVRAAPRPAPWLLLVDVERTRGVPASFLFDKEWTSAFPERLVYDVGARFYAAVRAAGGSAVEMPRAFRHAYRHYGGLSWRR